MEFEEIRGRLKGLSEYGDDLAGDRWQWHRHPNPDGSVGGWVHNQCVLYPGSVVEAEAIVFGRGVSLSKETRVRGRSIVGPGVVADGKVDIVDSHVCGYSWDQDKQGLPLHTQQTGWPLDHTHLRDSTVTGAKINASGIDRSEISGATLFGTGVDASTITGPDTWVRGTLVREGSHVGGGAEAVASIIEDGSSLTGRHTTAHHSTLTGSCQVAGGARVIDCVVEKGARVDRPNLQRVNEFIDNDRYAGPPRPISYAEIRLGADQVAGRTFKEELKRGPVPLARYVYGGEKMPETVIHPWKLERAS
ncbi:MAG: hypothetical protein PW734_03910 [Verrucomicrobium sp.]|nr:hypothetical protein [Verrucomicrobium sp.]